MSMQSWKSHRLIVGLVVLGCALLDIGALVALGYGITWLLGVTSPHAWVAAAVALIVIVRFARLARWVGNARRLATPERIATPKPGFWSDAPAG